MRFITQLSLLLLCLVGCTASSAEADDTAYPMLIYPMLIDTSTEEKQASVCEIAAAVAPCKGGEFRLGLLAGAMIVRLDQLDDDGQGVELEWSPTYLDPEDNLSRVNIIASCDDGELVRATTIWCR